MQFRLHDAFITSFTVEPDVTSSAQGEVDLVVAANDFQAESPTAGPGCDCQSVFEESNFKLLVGGQTKIVESVDEVGFTVPRLVSASGQYVPGDPVLRDLRVGVGPGSSGSLTSTRNYFRAWSDNEGQGNHDRRTGELDLLNAGFSSVAELHYSQLEPIVPFDPMFVDGKQSITLRPASLQFQ